MPGVTYPSKKALKAAVGTLMRPHFIETSIHGSEWPVDGTGEVVVVGPYPSRKWYATVTLRNGIIMAVK